MYFWYICIIFSIFKAISKEFKFSKVFWTRSTFNALILQSLIFWVDVDIARFKKYKKNEKNQNYKKKEKKRKRKVEGPVWKPRNISSINTMLQWNNEGGEKFTHGERREKLRGRGGIKFL